MSRMAGECSAWIAAERLRYPQKAIREQFGETLSALAEEGSDFIVLTADLMFATGLGHFGDRFAGRVVNLGIAEQNMAGVAAGLALCGKRPIVSGYAAFTSLRAIEQLKLDAAYNGVKIIFAAQSAGLSYGVGGPTHQTYEDIAVLRAIPNTIVLSPSDATEADACVRAALACERSAPIYIRLGRGAESVFNDPGSGFEIGQALTLREGRDLAIIATGAMVFEALLAADWLAQIGTRTRVLNVHSIKPLDHERLRQASQETSAMIVAEEHAIHGGLGSAVLEAIADQPSRPPVRLVGIGDAFPPIGPPHELRRSLGLDAEHIAELALAMCSAGGAELIARPAA